MTGEKNQQGQAGCAYEVATADNGPVPQQVASADLAVGPGHRQKIIPGKQLRARNHDKNQSEGKCHATEDLSGSKAQGGIGFHDYEVERAEADEGPGQYAEHQHGEQRQTRLGHADGLDFGGDFAGGESVEAEEFRHGQPGA